VCFFQILYSSLITFSSNSSFIALLHGVSAEKVRAEMESHEPEFTKTLSADRLVIQTDDLEAVVRWRGSNKIKRGDKH
jgi:hypothetical protein